MNKHNIVWYWHAIELLQPQSVPQIKKRDNLNFPFIHDTTLDEIVAPWLPESIVSEQMLPPNRVWSHNLYAHLYDGHLISAKLKEAFGADQGYREPPQHRESAMFFVKFTNEGTLVDNSLVLSSEAWFLGRVLTRRNWAAGFEEDRQTVNERATAMLAGEVSSVALQSFTYWIREFLGLSQLFNKNDYKLRFRSQPVDPSKLTIEDDPLNSFILEDLALVAKNMSTGVSSEALNKYLSRHNQSHRLHVNDDDSSLALIKQLLPNAYASSCWPTEHHLGLVHSQQLAVNRIQHTLADEQGLMGINGPPGTGKTTLLRDLIASIITSRADTLATFNRASDIFEIDPKETAIDGEKTQAVFKLKKSLYGFEIVVASSNNGAVENVTLELPQRDKIDESWLPEAEYFAELGELVTDKPAWGLISGALGSKTRRTKFVKAYFDGQSTVKTKIKNNAQTDNDIANELNDAAEPDESSTFLSDLDTDDLNTQPESKAASKGFKGWLDAYAERNKGLLNSSTERKTLWEQAVSEYKASKTEVDKITEDSKKISEYIALIVKARKNIVIISDQLIASQKNLTDLKIKIDLNRDQANAANLSLEKATNELEIHTDNEPSFWKNLFSLWRAQRNWETKLKILESKFTLANDSFDQISQSMKELLKSELIVCKHIDDLNKKLNNLRDKEHAASDNALNLSITYKVDHLAEWLKNGSIGHSDAIELSEPWKIEGWRQARAKVFIQALKLHRTFFELEAARVRSNLYFINSVLTGTRFKDVSQDAIRSAWATLFMVVPVLSSTFASFARSFGTLGAGEIGWLLVDEAGQATPQAAVGALWRSKRAVMVGDPIQLKPILTVPDAVLEHMRTRYQVDPHWIPNRQSAQTLADEATSWGRMAGPIGQKKWVGLPLVVHRRCDRPMYELANRIAYDNAMVYGTIDPKPEKETKASLQTGWFHVGGESDGNWVEAEGNLLQKLLMLLRKDGVEAKDISVITPFTDVRNNLKEILDRNIVYGTIHTMQGKESQVIIMVLGGKSNGSGARDWVVSEPNLLNVAATRAKRRFYVIGDRKDWEKRALFCDVMDLLPVMELD